MGFAPLVRPPRAAALPACEAQAHTSPCQGDLPGAHIAPYINERFALVVSGKATLRQGAGVRARSARPYGVDAAFGAPGSWPRMARRGRRALRNCTAIHLLAPYGVAVVPLPLTRQMGDSRKVSLTLTRAARPKGKGVIRKRGETIGVSPLVRLPRAAALSARDARAH